VRIEDAEDGFVEMIENGVVEKVVCRYDGVCTVHFYNRLPRDLDVGCSVYNRQYGIPVSEDGRRLFVGSWRMGLGGREKGLMAYDIDSGSLLWRFPEGRIRTILVHLGNLIVLRANASVVKLDIDNGTVLGQIRSTTIEHLFDLGSPYALVDTIAGKPSVVDTDRMLILKKYGPKIVNPANCLLVTIRGADLQDEELTIFGVQDYPNRDYASSDPQKFRRVIDAQFGASRDEGAVQGQVGR
jgi:hypothetical protein